MLLQTCNTSMEWRLPHSLLFQDKTSFQVELLSENVWLSAEARINTSHFRSTSRTLARTFQPKVESPSLCTLSRKSLCVVYEGSGPVLSNTYSATLIDLLFYMHTLIMVAHCSSLQRAIMTTTIYSFLTILYF